MNIAYIVFSFKVGGVEKLLIDILNEVSKDYNKNIYFIIINNDYDNHLIEQISNRVKVILLNREVGSGRIKYILKFAKLILRSHIDVVHCQGIDSVKFALLAKMLKKNIKLLHTVHDTTIYSKLSEFDVKIDQIFVNKIIAISSAVKEEILMRNINSSKVEIVYNAIKLDKFRFNGRKTLDVDSIVIGNVARLIPEKKGQDILIKAISELKESYPNIKCLLAGAPPVGKEENIDYLEKICEEYGVSDNVEILGNINDIPNFLKSIDIFIMPSRYDGFGIALIEAMAVGIPCIASDIDGPKEIIKNNEYGLLFKSKDYNDLSQKIEKTVDNYNEIDTIKIRKYVSDNYEIEAMVQKLNALYQK